MKVRIWLQFSMAAAAGVLVAFACGCKRDASNVKSPTTGHPEEVPIHAPVEAEVPPASPPTANAAEAPNPSATKDGSPPPPSLEEIPANFNPGALALVKLRRTGCLGQCPAYSVAVRSDGAVFYSGGMFTKVEGFASARIPAADAAALLQSIERRGFARMKPVYRRMATDHPSVITTLRRAGRTHTVRHDTSNREAPAALEAIENEIDAVAGSTRWAGTGDDDRSARARRAASDGKSVEEADIRWMIGGNAIANVERACGLADKAIPVKADLDIDDEGVAFMGAASIQGAGDDADDVTACVRKHVARWVFPVGGLRHVRITFRLAAKAAH